MRIAVVTCSVPERHAMLAENMASVRAQTLAPVGHYVGIDYERAGCVANLNRTVNAALSSGADWIAQLADDDLFYPRHLAALAAVIPEGECAGFGEEGPPCDGCPGAPAYPILGPDVVYSWCDVTGRDGFNPNRHFDPDELRRHNYIPATTLIRSSLVAALDGWRPGAHGFEDWDFWLRALDAGARFACVPEVTWSYRFGSWGNVSWGARA